MRTGEREAAPTQTRVNGAVHPCIAGLELVTGGQRLHHVADYRAALAERGMDPAPFAWYLDAFAHGMPPHGGFAIGLERLVARLTGTANLREVTLFPRDINRLTP